MSTSQQIYISRITLIHTSNSHFVFLFFFFNDTATTEIYTLSLHDALPISMFLAISIQAQAPQGPPKPGPEVKRLAYNIGDRKSTRLNSSHGYISYAVFCLKKKNKNSFVASTT